MATPAKKSSPETEAPAETGTDLIVLENLNPAVVFKPGGTDEYVAELEALAGSFTGDISTEEGRKDIRRFARKLASSRQGLDDMGKDFVAGLKKAASEVDAERKKMRDRVNELIEHVLAPEVEWQRNETARLDGHKAKLEQIKNLGILASSDTGSAEIAHLIETLEMIAAHNPDGTPYDWQEFKDLANQATEYAAGRLDQYMEEALQREAQLAELDRLRKEKEERDQKDREAASAAAAKAQAEKEAADRLREESERAARAEEREKLAQEEAAQAKANAAAQAEKAAADATKRELERQQEEEAQKARDEAARAADKAHRARINNAAVDAMLVASPDVTREQAINILRAIVEGKVAHVKITY
jgi:hypothetical protein